MYIMINVLHSHWWGVICVFHAVLISKLLNFWNLIQIIFANKLVKSVLSLIQKTYNRTIFSHLLVKAEYIWENSLKVSVLNRISKHHSAGKKTVALRQKSLLTQIIIHLPKNERTYSIINYVKKSCLQVSNFYV